MGFFNFFKRKQKALTSSPPTVSVEVYTPAKEATLTDHSKKEIMVQRVTLQDMEQFSALPFVWNSEIKKVMGPSTQPYAYMDIVGSNIFAACLALEEMNERLLEANKHIYPAYRIIQIPVDEIDFTPSKESSYSKIICNPHTFTGRVSKYPASLHFMTPHVIDGDSTHGELFFDKTGAIRKAEIFCWREKWRKSFGFFFFYKTIDGSLLLDRIEFSSPQHLHRERKTIYNNQQKK